MGSGWQYYLFRYSNFSLLNYVMLYITEGNNIKQKQSDYVQDMNCRVWGPAMLTYFESRISHLCLFLYIHSEISVALVNQFLQLKFTNKAVFLKNTSSTFYMYHKVLWYMLSSKKWFLQSVIRGSDHMIWDFTLILWKGSRNLHILW